MKVIAVGGVRSSGKSAVTIRFIQRNLPILEHFRSGRISGVHYKNIVVVGAFSEEPSRKLRMPQFFLWVSALLKSSPQGCLFIEGSVFFQERVFAYLRKIGCQVMPIVLDLTERERKRRDSMRGLKSLDVSDERKSFDKMVASKSAIRVFHETQRDTDFLVERIDKFLGL